MGGHFHKRIYLEFFKGTVTVINVKKYLYLIIFKSAIIMQIQVIIIWETLRNQSNYRPFFIIFIFIIFILQNRICNIPFCTIYTNKINGSLSVQNKNYLEFSTILQLSLCRSRLEFRRRKLKLNHSLYRCNSLLDENWIEPF